MTRGVRAGSTKIFKYPVSDLPAFILKSQTEQTIVLQSPGSLTTIPFFPLACFIKEASDGEQEPDV